MFHPIIETSIHEYIAAGHGYALIDLHDNFNERVAAAALEARSAKHKPKAEMSER